MKQTNKTMFGSSKRYEQELVVSDILLDLETIISLSESKRDKFTWGVKRKRSVPPSLPPVVNEQTRVKLVENNLASPNTPLAFFPTESDENNNNGLMESLKNMTKDECVKMEEQLIRNRDCLRREVENMKRFYRKLKDENAELKSKKEQVLKSFQIEENPQMEENMPVKYYGENMVPYHNLEVEDPNTEYRFDFADFNGHGPVNNVGPSGIPDLNVSAEEAFGLEVSRPLDMDAVNAEKRAKFAEARRLRRAIIKIKAMRSACGVTLPTIS